MHKHHFILGIKMYQRKECVNSGCAEPAGRCGEGCPTICLKLPMKCIDFRDVCQVGNWNATSMKDVNANIGNC